VVTAVKVVKLSFVDPFNAIVIKIINVQLKVCFFFENEYFQFSRSFHYSNKHTLSTYKNTQPWFCKKGDRNDQGFF